MKCSCGKRITSIERMSGAVIVKDTKTGEFKRAVCTDCVKMRDLRRSGKKPGTYSI